MFSRYRVRRNKSRLLWGGGGGDIRDMRTEVFTGKTYVGPCREMGEMV